MNKIPSKVYTGIINIVDDLVPKKMRPFWLHPAGPKTIYFWAPFFKWGLVVAGLSDLRRPAENISIHQCEILVLTGLIWSRYSLVIVPKNHFMFSVNIFIAITQAYQSYRAYSYMKERDSEFTKMMESTCNKNFKMYHQNR